MAQSDAPLNLVTVGTGNAATQRLFIYVGIGTGAPKPYLFDTGSNSFNAAYNPAWFPAPSSVIANSLPYVYETDGYQINEVSEPAVSFYSPNNLGGQPTYTATPSAGIDMGQITYHVNETVNGSPLFTYNGTNFYVDTAYSTAVAAGNAPLPGGIYGTFGAADYVSTTSDGKVTYGSALGQIAGGSGYVVSANGATGTGAIQNGTTSCAPQCVTIGLNASIRALYTSLIPWDGTTANFPNTTVPGSKQFGTPFTITLAEPASGGNPAQSITWTTDTLLDTGTGNLNLHTSQNLTGFVDSKGNLLAGTQMTITGGTLGATSTTITIQPASVTGSTADSGTASASAVTNTVGIAFFLNNSVMYDLANQLVGISPYFITADNFTTSLAVGGGSRALGLAGVISGANTLTLGNGGNVMLSGANTYTGNTTINPGGYLALAGPGGIAASSGVIDNGIFDLSLACAGYDGGAATCSGVSVTDLSGTGAVYLGAQTLSLTNAVSNFSGVLADTGTGAQLVASGGGLNVAGGTATLSGVNTYTGPTSIQPGATLALGGAGSIATSSGLANAGVFDISATNQGAVITSLSGTGQVNLGAQPLTLGNANGSFSGVIADGGLAGGAGGRLIVAGGTQILTGANTYTGGTTITGGATLAVNADAALGAATAPLTLDNGTLFAIANLTSTRPITVSLAGGTVNANGYEVSLGGPLTLAGQLTTLGDVQLAGQSVVNGTVTESGGKLSVDGDLTATSVVVNNDGTLRGTGTVRAPTTVDGTLAPGDSPGTLTFTKAVTLTARATTAIDIDGTGTGKGAGNYSRISVDPRATLTLGGKLAPKLRGIIGSATNLYTPPIGQTFSVISAPGGLLGSYTSLDQPDGRGAGTRFDALYSPVSLMLVVTPAQYANLGAAGLPESSNEAAVGAALDAIRPAAGTAMSAGRNALFAPLYLLPGPAIAGTLDSLAPTIVADDLLVRRDSWNMVGSAIEAELQARRGARLQDGQQSAPLATGPVASGTVWMSGLGQFVSVDSHGAPGYSSTMGGGAAGIDLPVLPWLTAGIALGWTSPNAQDGTSAHLAGDALQAVAYGSLHQGSAFLDVQAGGGFSETDYYRPQPLYGVRTQGNSSGTAGGASVQAGLHLEDYGWQVEPSLKLGGVSLQQGGFTESTGAPAALSIGAQGLASVQTLLGARAERRFALNDTLSVVPRAQLGWLHEFADTRATSTASFAAAAGTPFTVQSAPIGRDSAVLGVGAALETGGPWSVFAS